MIINQYDELLGGYRKWDLGIDEMWVKFWYLKADIGNCLPRALLPKWGAAVPRGCTK